VSIPAPQSGMVISYSYLWHDEKKRGREEGVKNRPCAIIMTVQDDDGDEIVYGFLPTDLFHKIKSSIHENRVNQRINLAQR
jgi:hypothetical protein